MRGHLSRIHSVWRQPSVDEKRVPCVCVTTKHLELFGLRLELSGVFEERWPHGEWGKTWCVLVEEEVEDGEGDPDRGETVLTSGSAPPKYELISDVKSDALSMGRETNLIASFSESRH